MPSRAEETVRSLRAEQSNSKLCAETSRAERSCRSIEANQQGRDQDHQDQDQFSIKRPFIGGHDNIVSRSGFALSGVVLYLRWFCEIFWGSILLISQDRCDSAPVEGFCRRRGLCVGTLWSFSAVALVFFRGGGQSGSVLLGEC